MGPFPTASIAVALVAAASLHVSVAAAAPARSVVYPVRTMGTFATVTLVTADSSASAPAMSRITD